jgi:hypothetical protein
MGTVYRKTATKPFPNGAELFKRNGQQFARWTNAKGRTKTAPVTTGTEGRPRIVVTARTFTAKYRNGQGIVREVATGCRDEQAVRSVLADLERRAVRVKAKIVTATEDAVIDHMATPMARHFDDYYDHLGATGASPAYRENTVRQLRRLAADCGFVRLDDLSFANVDRWLAARAKDNMAPRTRNSYRADVVEFGNWCVETSRLTTNPVSTLSRAVEKGDRRRTRRAMTGAELVRLLDVASRRPLLDAMTVRRGKRKGEASAKVRPEVIERLERLGRERALIYKALVLTGLRKGELVS